MRRNVLVASTNPAKQERLRSLLASQGVVFHSLDEVEDAEPPEDLGGSHREVARQKAEYWAKNFGGLAIASDGGLLIPALGPAWDSLYTRRATGETATDDERVGRLLKLMEPYDGEDRAARWMEAVALADEGEVIAEWEVDGPKGYLLRAPVASRIPGFWAASLWFFPEFGKAYTEMTPEELRRVGDPWTRLWEYAQNDFNMGRVML